MSQFRRLKLPKPETRVSTATPELQAKAEPEQTPLSIKNGVINSATLTPSTVLKLQHTVGNQALQRILATRKQTSTPPLNTVVQRNHHNKKGKKSGGGSVATPSKPQLSLEEEAASNPFLAELMEEESNKEKQATAKKQKQALAAQKLVEKQAALQAERDKNYYPTGQRFTDRTEDQLWDDLEVDKMPPSNKKAKEETSEGKAKRLQQAYSQILVLATNKEVARAMYALKDSVRFIRDKQTGTMREVLTEITTLTVDQMRSLVAKLYNPLSLAEVKVLITGLKAGGVLPPAIVALVNALVTDAFKGDTLNTSINGLKAKGLTPLQAVTLLTMLGAEMDGPTANIFIGEFVAAGMTASQFYETVNRLSTTATLTPTAIKDILTALKNKKLSGGDIYGQVGSTLDAGRAASTITSTFPTGQNYLTLTEDQLWTHCKADTRLKNVTVGQPDETEEQSKIRVKLALNELKRINGVVPALVQAVFDQDNGQKPRKFADVATEDGFGGHTQDRHVLNGTGTVPDADGLAQRVWLNIPDCPNKAGAFNTAADANTALVFAANKIETNWANFRRDLIRGNDLSRTYPYAAGGTVLVKAYATEGTGSPGVPGSQEAWDGPRPKIGVPAPDLEADLKPLTMQIAATQLYVRVVADVDAKGGMYVNSAWPQ